MYKKVEKVHDKCVEIEKGGKLVTNATMKK